MERKRTIISFIATGALLALLACIDLIWGLGILSGEKWSPEKTSIISLIRLPRLLSAVIAGGALALAGCQMQGILRNPLADPHIMGITSGASLGAALTVLSCSSVASLPAMQNVSIVGAAFIGAVLAAILVLAVAGRFHDPGTLLIFGVMLGFIVNAVIVVLQSSGSAEAMKTFHGWSSGNFSTTSWTGVAVLAATAAGGALAGILNSRGLDAIMFGEEFAELAGTNPRSTRVISILSCCIITAGVTAFCGPIGFVGIIGPHIARWTSGTSVHRTVLPLSMLCGSLIAVLADTISHISGSPLPVSSTMALVGVPVILYILLKKPASAV